MEQHSPIIHTPVQQAIEQIISFPAMIFSDTEKRQMRRKHTLSQMELQEKEESLNRLQSVLTARSAELQKKEESLSERWDTGRIYSLPIKCIEANPHQPRREFEELSLFSLANSIREHGILQPLTVRRIPLAANDGDKPSPQDPACHYQLICGERRLRAAAAVGMKTVPCIILEADNRRAAELALIENLQRENLNLFEQAGAIAALIDMHAMTQEEIARALSVSQSYIANKLRVLRLTADEREIILTAHLTERHARAFLRIKDLELRRSTVRTAAREGLNVAQTEQYIDRLLSSPPALLAKESDQTPDIHKLPTVKNQSSSTQTRKCILKDLRLFFNTVDRAVTALREAGFTAECRREETDGTVRLTVSVSGNDKTPSESGSSSPMTANPT